MLARRWQVASEALIQMLSDISDQADELIAFVAGGVEADPSSTRQGRRAPVRRTRPRRRFDPRGQRCGRSRRGLDPLPLRLQGRARATRGTAVRSPRRADALWVVRRRRPACACVGGSPHGRHALGRAGQRRAGPPWTRSGSARRPSQAPGSADGADRDAIDAVLGEQADHVAISSATGGIASADTCARGVTPPPRAAGAWSTRFITDRRRVTCPRGTP